MYDEGNMEKFHTVYVVSPQYSKNSRAQAPRVVRRACCRRPIPVPEQVRCSSLESCLIDLYSPEEIHGC